MTVKELMQKLQYMPQDIPVFAEGKLADAVQLENCKGDQCVRIFKLWDMGIVEGSAGLKEED